MRRAFHRHKLSLVALAAAGIIGLVAIADHRNKQARINRAEVSEWFCKHRGQRCGGPSSRRIEDHWNERQLGYEAIVAVLAGFAVVRTARVSLRKRS